MFAPLPERFAPPDQETARERFRQAVLSYAAMLSSAEHATISSSHESIRLVLPQPRPQSMILSPEQDPAVKSEETRLQRASGDERRGLAQSLSNRSLAGLLGSEDFDIREIAERVLTDRGLRSAPALQAALGSSDPEIVDRATRIIPQLEVNTDSVPLLKQLSGPLPAREHALNQISKLLRDNSKSLELSELQESFELEPGGATVNSFMNRFKHQDELAAALFHILHDPKRSKANEALALKLFYSCEQPISLFLNLEKTESSMSNAPGKVTSAASRILDNIVERFAASSPEQLREFPYASIALQRESVLAQFERLAADTSRDPKQREEMLRIISEAKVLKNLSDLRLRQLLGNEPGSR